MTQKQQQKTDIKKYVTLLTCKRHLASAVFLAISAFFVIAAYLTHDKYEVSSSVMVEDNVISNLMEGITVRPSLDDKLRNISAAMTSRPLINDVIEKMGLNGSMTDQKDIDGMVDRVRKNMKITIGNDGRKVSIFTVSYRDGNPRIAFEMVNNLIDRYISRNIIDQTEEAYGASKFVSDQIDEFKRKIDVKDREIMEYRKGHGIFAAIDETNILNDIKTIQEKVDDLEIQKMDLEGKKGHIEKQMQQSGSSASKAMNRRAGVSMSDNLVALRKELSGLLTKYTEKYPEVIRVESEIKTLEEQIRTGKAGDAVADGNVGVISPLRHQLNDDLAKIEYDIAGLNAKQDTYRRLIESKKDELKNVPEDRKKLADMERERESYRNIYERLIERLSQSEVTKSMEMRHEGINFRIVDPAVLPTRPVSPNRLKLILVGILAGLVGGIGIVVAIDELDGTFKSSETLKQYGLRVLAVIPEIQTPQELAILRRHDVIMFSVSGLYILGILFLLTIELFV